MAYRYEAQRAYVCLDVLLSRVGVHTEEGCCAAEPFCNEHPRERQPVCICSFHSLVMFSLSRRSKAELSFCAVKPQAGKQYQHFHAKFVK